MGINAKVRAPRHEMPMTRDIQPIKPSDPENLGSTDLASSPTSQIRHTTLLVNVGLVALGGFFTDELTFSRVG